MSYNNIVTANEIETLLSPYKDNTFQRVSIQVFISRESEILGDIISETISFRTTRDNLNYALSNLKTVTSTSPTPYTPLKFDALQVSFHDTDRYLQSYPLLVYRNLIFDWSQTDNLYKATSIDNVEIKMSY